MMDRTARSNSPDASLSLPVKPTRAPDLLEVFWRGRWFILAAIAICSAAAFVYLQKATPLFLSNARLYVEQSGPKVISSDTVGAMAPSANYLSTQCELLRSTTILNTAIESSGLRELRTFAGVENPLGMIRAGLTVEPAKNTDIITVSYLSAHPGDAAKIVNAIVDSYISYHANQKKSTAAEVLKILQKEKDIREAELQTKLKGLLDFRRANSSVTFDPDGSEKGDVARERLSNLASALTTAQLAATEAKADFEIAKSAVADPASLRQLKAAHDSGQLSPAQNASGATTESIQLRFHLLELQEQMDELTRRVLPDHPSYQALQAKLEAAQSRLSELDAISGESGQMTEAQFGKAYVAAADQRWKDAMLREKEVENAFGASLEEQRKQASDVNNKIATYQLLESDFKRTQNLCDMLDSRMKELHITEDTGALNISVLESARPALSPSKPEKARITAIALVLGLILGSGFSFVSAWMDQRIRSAEELSSLLGVPVLGVVPQVPGRCSPPVVGQQVQMASTSGVAEAYRTVRTAIYFGVMDPKLKTLLITSATAGEGKTTSVSNLAIAMAQAGQRTLILDADFRKPSQHKTFGVRPKVGLSHVLAGIAPVKEAIQKTGIDNLDLLPVGPLPKNPSEALNSPAFGDLIAKVAQDYDHVVIDSPPVVPVTDARILGAMSDLTVLVMRADKSTRRTCQYARDALLSIGTNLLGVIVNGVSRSGSYGYYYGYYREGYGRKGEHEDGTGGNGANEAEAAAPGRVLGREREVGTKSTIE